MNIIAVIQRPGHHFIKAAWLMSSIHVICFSTDVTGGYCEMRTHTHCHYSGSQCLVLKLHLNGSFFFKFIHHSF